MRILGKRTGQLAVMARIETEGQPDVWGTPWGDTNKAAPAIGAKAVGGHRDCPVICQFFSKCMQASILARLKMPGMVAGSRSRWQTDNITWT
jgi:hypothetical protein